MPEPCPYEQRKSVGDETYTICEFNGEPCLIEYGQGHCDYYGEFLEELEGEEY